MSGITVATNTHKKRLLRNRIIDTQSRHSRCAAERLYFTFLPEMYTMMRRISLLLALTFTLAACGQKGDLYLPDEKQEQEQGQQQENQQPQQ
jgi:predicted small lipoprotein YifL